MKRTIPVWQLLGSAVVSFLGTLLHFLYEWTGEGLLAAPFSGVNESTWEHMKLLFFPMLLFALIQRLFFRDKEDFWCIKLKSTLLGLVLIPVIFYTYNGVIGRSPDWVNIAIFFVSAAIAYFYEAKIWNTTKTPCPKKAAFFALLLIAAAFVIFTFYTPELSIFKDPLTGKFGIR